MSHNSWISHCLQSLEHGSEQLNNLLLMFIHCSLRNTIQLACASVFMGGKPTHLHNTYGWNSKLHGHHSISASTGISNLPPWAVLGFSWHPHTIWGVCAGGGERGKPHCIIGTLANTTIQLNLTLFSFVSRSDLISTQAHQLQEAEGTMAPSIFALKGAGPPQSCMHHKSL